MLVFLTTDVRLPTTKADLGLLEGVVRLRLIRAGVIVEGFWFHCHELQLVVPGHMFVR